MKFTIARLNVTIAFAGAMFFVAPLLPGAGPASHAIGAERWVAQVNRAETEEELNAVRRSVVRGTPLGEDAWVQRTAQRLCLDSTLRARGRPKKNPVKAR